MPRDWAREPALDDWCGSAHEEVVAEDGGFVVGSYYLRANQQGGDVHVANWAYVTGVRGRGVGCTMCLHSVPHAALRVVGTNDNAVVLWKSWI